MVLNSTNRTWAVGNFTIISSTNFIPFKILLPLPINSPFHEFYALSYFAALLGVLTWVYYSHYLPKVCEFNDNYNARATLTFTLFITMGIQKFESHLTRLIEERERESIAIKKQRRMQIDEAKDQIVRSRYMQEFVATIYRLLDADLNMIEYVGRIMEEAVLVFFNKSDAAYTYMVYNADEDCLECKHTTRDVNNKPGKIYLEHPNIFMECVRQKQAILYSNNVGLHFVTSNNGIDKQLYCNYVAFYIDKQQDNKPLHALCLEAVSDAASIRLQALYELNLFGYIEHAFREKLGMIVSTLNSENNKEHEKKTEQKR